MLRPRWPSPASLRPSGRLLRPLALLFLANPQFTQGFQGFTFSLKAAGVLKGVTGLLLRLPGVLPLPVTPFLLPFRCRHDDPSGGDGLGREGEGTPRANTNEIGPISSLLGIFF